VPPVLLMPSLSVGAFVAQRLQQPAHSVVVFGRAEENRHDQALAQVFGQAGVDFLGGRDDVLE